MQNAASGMRSLNYFYDFYFDIYIYFNGQIQCGRSDYSHWESVLQTRFFVPSPL